MLVPLSAGTREREFPLQRKPQKWTTNSGKTWITGEGSTFKGGKQKTVSQSHRRNPKTGKYETGGPFYTVLTKLLFPTVLYHGQNTTGVSQHYSHVGTPMIGLSAEERNFTYPFSKIRSEDLSDLDAKGATAIHLSEPLNEWANLGVALGETYRDGLPSLPGVQTWKGRTQICKAAGGEYLNTVFGWMPLVKDVKDTSQSVRRSRDLTNRFMSGVGRNEHVRFDFDDIRTVTRTKVSEKSFASPYITGGTDFSYSLAPLADQGPLYKSVEKVTKTWFEGCFTYGIPAGSDYFSTISRYGSEADKLFNLELTPDLLWELAPWSWAVDWFSNTGDVISNISKLELQGLVMRYGYVMSEVTETTTFTLEKSGLKDLSSPPPPSQIVKISKVRQEANPFGFGVSWEGLSPFQIAVTAALGITRLR